MRLPVLDLKIKTGSLIPRAACSRCTKCRDNYCTTVRCCQKRSGQSWISKSRSTGDVDQRGERRDKRTGRPDAGNKISEWEKYAASRYAPAQGHSKDHGNERDESSQDSEGC